MTENFKITKDFYDELHTLTIDPPVKLESLMYHNIFKVEEGYAIVWIKDIHKKGTVYYAAGERRGVLDTHEQAVMIMKLAELWMKKQGLHPKR